MAELQRVGLHDGQEILSTNRISTIRKGTIVFDGTPLQRFHVAGSKWINCSPESGFMEMRPLQPPFRIEDVALLIYTGKQERTLQITPHCEPYVELRVRERRTSEVVVYFDPESRMYLSWKSPAVRLRDDRSKLNPWEARDPDAELLVPLDFAVERFEGGKSKVASHPFPLIN